MNRKRTLVGLWSIASIAWLAFLATQFDLVRTGAVSLPLFLEAAIGAPAVLWLFGFVAVWAARGFGSGKKDGSK